MAIIRLGFGTDPAISGTNVVWEGGNDIYYFDGSNTTRLTGDITLEINPAISGTNIVWEGLDVATYHEIFYWNGTTITRLTNNSIPDTNPAISGTNVVWESGSEIYYWNGTTTTQLTNNTMDDENPAISGTNIVWQGYDGNDWELYYWNGTTTTQLTDNTTDDTNPAISGTNIVWQGYDGNDSEIYYWNGTTTTQLTDNTTDDRNPAISGMNVVWQGHSPTDFARRNTEIYYWNGTTTTQLTDNTTNDMNPAISGMNVAWASDGEILFTSDPSDPNSQSSPLTLPMTRFHDLAKPGSYLFVAPPEAESLRQNPSRYHEEGFAFAAAASPEGDPLLKPFFRYVDTAPGREGNYLYVAEPEAISIDQNNPNFVKQGVAFYAYYGGQGPSTIDFARFITPSGAYFFAGISEAESLLLSRSELQELGQNIPYGTSSYTFDDAIINDCPFWPHAYNMGGCPAPPQPGLPCRYGFTYQGLAFAAGG